MRLRLRGEQEADLKMPWGHRAAADAPVVGVERVFESKCKRGPNGSDIAIESELGVEHHEPVTEAAPVARDGSTTRIAGGSTQGGRSPGESPLGFRLRSGDVENGFAEGRCVRIGSISRVSERVGEIGRDGGIGRERPPRSGRELGPERADPAHIRRRPVSLARGLPDDLIPAPVAESGQLEVSDRPIEPDADVAAPAVLGSQVGSSAGLPVAVVERRNAEGAPDLGFQAKTGTVGEGLQVDANARTDRRSLVAPGHPVGVGSDRGKERDATVAARGLTV